MDARTNKNRLIETLRIERARWDMLLVQVSSDRMTTPGVDGKLSVRDILVDVVRQERWAASQLRLSADTGNRPPTDATAPRLYPEALQEERVPSLSVGELLDESRRTFEQIVWHLMHLPAEDMFSAHKYEWTGGAAVGAIIPAYTVEHYRRYDGSIRRWMTKRRRRARAALD